MQPTRTHRLPLLATLPALATLACASVGPPPPPDVADRARSAASYSGSLRVRLKGPGLRARTRALVAFERPRNLRIEVPGPAGARLIAVARAERLTAVFPADRAVFSGGATAGDLDALLGVALTPTEVMDLLVGAPPARVKLYQARWGPALPRQITATLPDDTRLEVDVDEPELGPRLPAAAFDEPPHEGYRPIDAGAARDLIGGRR